MDRVQMSEECRARIREGLEGRAPEDGPSGRRKSLRMVAVMAAVLVALTGSALAVAQSAGLLDLFFKGDTSLMEPYVQTVIDSAENENYRFTADSALYDGQNIYAVVTLEALNDQAADDLMSNRAFAEVHRETWGEDMVEGLMKSRSTGPDGICYDYTQHLGGKGIKDLPDPTDHSRSWQIDIEFHEFLGVLEDPLEVWISFMGRDCAVKIPLTTMVDPIRITPNEEVTVNTLMGLKGTLKEFILTPLSFHVTLERTGDWSAYNLSTNALDAATDRFFLRMKDGSILTSSQLGVVNNQFETVVDLDQVESIIFGYTEFPVDGSPSKPADLDPKLYPFVLSYPASQDMDQLFENKVSLRLLCRGLGADYKWNEKTQTATATYRGVTVKATVGSTTVYVDGQPVEIREKEVPSAERDANGVRPTAPNPVTASDFPEDLLVNLYPLEDAWDIEFFTNRFNAENTDEDGNRPFLACGTIVFP